MKSIFILLLYALIILFAGCKKNADLSGNSILLNRDTLEVARNIIWSDLRKTLDSAYYGLRFYPEGNYKNIRNAIENQRQHFKQELLDTTKTEEIILQKAGKYLEEALVNKIIPHWYDTPWDFNGYTNKPNKGKIACGYFVSTTLKHAGFNINRYKFAQQFGKISGESLQSPMNIVFCEDEVQYATLNNTIKSALKDEGLYFVGLSCHVGYLLYRKNNLFFIHSSYCTPMKVVIEKTTFSESFTSPAYYFSAISTNMKLVKKWILNNRIDIPSSEY